MFAIPRRLVLKIDPSPSSDEIPSLDQEAHKIEALLARAAAEFDGPQQRRSIVLFDEIVNRLGNPPRRGSLTRREREILARSYELRGRAYYNIGLQDKAAESFRSLVQFQPQYAISRDRVSPKVVDFFNGVKKTLVGFLAVSTRPPGARVSLNGQFLATSDFFPMEVMSGEYSVEIAREGYRIETRALSIAPRATETLQVDLAGVTVSEDERATLNTPRGSASPTPAPHAGTAAVSQPSVPTDPDLAKGIRQVTEEGDLEGAVETLTAFVRRLSADSGRTKELCQGYLYLGISLAGMRQEDAARGYFREALLIDRDLRLDAARHPRGAVKLFDAVRQELR